jgi:soluble lytic murein transglycosylase-like protein
MTSVRLRRARLVALGPLGLAVGLMLGSAPPEQAAPTPPATTTPASLAAAPAPPATLLDASAVAPAARALRRRDCSAAIARLDPLVALGGAEATSALLLQGLYAHACEDVALAASKLTAAAEPGGRFDDWRLFVLADSAAAENELPVAEAALATLLGDFPDSPLVPRALARAATLAWRRQDGRAALELVDAARRRGVSGAAAAELETLAWQIGSDLGDPAVRAAAARRLLVEAPLQATRLNVADAYRLPTGDVAWTTLLSSRDLERRAASFLALDMPPAARSTLDAVPAAERGDRWRLLEAKALTADRQGMAALAALADAEPASAAERGEVEWARALAALDAATAYRGRKNLPSAVRGNLHTTALLYLRAAAAPGGVDALRAKALRRLFSELSDDGPFDDALAVLRQLRDLDPQDATGARYLWDLGWEQYAARNYSGAVGYWSELASLYPENRYARGGRYWTGRAFEALGQRTRAHDVFSEIAAVGVNDFYRRHALDRLGGDGAAAAGDPPRQPWPEDPALDRARLLTDCGLDDLALAEVDAVGDRAEPRAAAALTALAEARRGDRLQSIAAIRQAFPSLGGPFQMRLPEEALRIYYPLDYEDVIRVQAERTRLPIDLLFGIIRQESAFDPRMRSRAGARGLMQVMPATGREIARHLGLPWSTAKLADPEFNLRLGATYFRQVMKMFDDNLDLALAGYNGGPYRIKRLWTQAGAGRELDAFLEGLTLEESKTYVKRILVLSDSYRQLYPNGRRGADSEL